MRTIKEEWAEAMALAYARAFEADLRAMLGRWVSGVEAVAAVDARTGELIGLGDGTGRIFVWRR